MRGDLGDTLSVLGERWVLVILREISLGLRRFDDLRAATGAPRAVLADRLRRLTDLGVLTTRAYRLPGSRARVEYVLTEAGIDLLPVLAALRDWSARHLRATTGRDVEYHHIACGGHVQARLLCECGQQVSPHDRLVAQINR